VNQAQHDAIRKAASISGEKRHTEAVARKERAARVAEWNADPGTCKCLPFPHEHDRPRLSDGPESYGWVSGKPITVW